jgi:hypothetical protein
VNSGEWWRSGDFSWRFPARSVASCILRSRTDHRSRAATALRERGGMDVCISLLMPGNVPAQSAAPPALIGIDHMPLAVESLELASEDYSKLGFVSGGGQGPWPTAPGAPACGTRNLACFQRAGRTRMK